MAKIVNIWIHKGILIHNNIWIHKGCLSHPETLNTQSCGLLVFLFLPPFSCEVSYSGQGATSDVCHSRHRLRMSKNAATKSSPPCKTLLV